MLVKNTGQKTIGFGALVLPPDAVDTLPTGFDAKHPTVQFYLSKGWLTEVKEKDNTPPPANLPQDPPPELTEEQKAAAETAAQKAAEIDAKLKAIARMTLEQLRVEATNLGVEWIGTDTRAVLIQKITENLQADQPRG